MNKIEIVQQPVVRYIGFGNYVNPTSPIFKRSYFLKLQNLRDLDILKQMHRYYNDSAPGPLQNLFVRNTEVRVYGTRQRANLRQTDRQTDCELRYFITVIELSL